MVPWIGGIGVERAAGTEALPEFLPGRRGTWLPEIARSSLYYLQNKGGDNRPSGAMLVKNNSATLAWIAGAPERFTGKDHSFYAGETVSKQLVFISDEQPLSYRGSWSAEVGGKVIASGKTSGALTSGQVMKFPVEFKLPQAVEAKTDGTIKLEAEIGDRKSSDSFSFRVFPPATALQRELAAFDPEGRTIECLKAAGVNCKAWQGENVPLLVIGRNALSDKTKLPVDLERYVSSGGRVIFFSQSDSWLKNNAGMRYSPYVTRRAFAVNATHPLMMGLDQEDLRDWRGAGSSVPTGCGPTDEASRLDPYGWHWGNYGSVSSRAVEIPHFSAWKPILQCEFDQMYSPLLEMDYGMGKAVYVALDLEDRGAVDPVAKLLLDRLLTYCAETKTRTESVRTGYLGDADGEKILKTIGLEYTPADKEKSELIVAAATCREEELAEYTRKGVPVVILPGRSGNLPFGAALTKTERFPGALTVPDWPECRGIAVADLRRRADSPAWLLTGGCEIGASGLLGKKMVNKSPVIYCQLDMDLLQADKFKYLRYTRWHACRVLSRLLANAGGHFSADGNVFITLPEEQSLEKDWKGMLTAACKPAAKPLPFTPISELAKQAVQPGYDDSKWQNISPLTLWDEYGPEWKSADGESVFRLWVDVPPQWAGKDLEVSLGVLDDFDETFWNGVKIGGTGVETKNSWSVKRLYVIPGRSVTAGRNCLAIRIFDNFGSGGFNSKAEELFIRTKPTKKPAPLYYPDYIDDQTTGDNPYRYQRW